VQGTLHGKWMKKSLDLRNWDSAQKLVRDWESGHLKTAELSSITKACDAFLRDCEARELSSASISKYKLLTEELKEEFAGRTVGSLSVDEVRRYRETWELAPISAPQRFSAFVILTCPNFTPQRRACHSTLFGIFFLASSLYQSMSRVRASLWHSLARTNSF
jgi:hypothetical protein